MPITRYVIGREYARIRAVSDVDLSAITPEAALTAIGTQPDTEDWEEIASEADGDDRILLALIGNPPADGINTFALTEPGDLQLWARYEAGDEIVVRPVEIVEAV